MSVFHFKQFELRQDKCAMKIGTDGVLLGAWANVAQASSILDIGTGTGVLALMVAQRNSNAYIDAIEINTDAQAQARSNFAQSPWSERLHLHPSALQDYVLQASAASYDSIICNPPYYPSESNTPIAQQARQQARSTVNLDFCSLLEAARRLITPTGNFSLIIPTQEAQQFCSLAKALGWYLSQRVAVISRMGKASNRYLLELKRHPCSCVEKDLVLRPIRGADKTYTAAFETLHRDFLLFL